MSVARYIVAGLGAAASVSGMPYNQSTSASWTSATASVSTTYSIPSSTSTSPPGAPVPVLGAADAATLGKAVSSELTNVRKFNQLLTVDGAGAALLPADEIRQRTVFDFNQANQTGDGGRVLGATVGNFPLLVDQGLSTTVAFLEPCSMNSPHTHPRASEWLTVVDGNIRTGFMLENGFLQNADEGRLTTEIDTQLGKFQGTLFPMGSIHYQFNDNCAPATFVATLSSEDPGTSQIAQNFFFQDDVIVDVVLGEIQTINGQNIEQFRGTLPANLIQAVDTCLAQCGM